MNRYISFGNGLKTGMKYVATYDIHLVRHAHYSTEKTIHTELTTITIYAVLNNVQKSGT